MEAWILIAVYVLLLVVLQFLIYWYLRADGEPALGSSVLIDGSPHDEADIYNGATPPRDRSWMSESRTEDADADGSRTCPHCGSVNGRRYTYCWNCIALIGR